MTFGMCPAVGKRRRRRNCRWKEPIANECTGDSASRSDGFPAAIFRRLPKPSFLVFSRGIPLHKLSDSKPRSLDFARDDSGDRR
jgi:hypothetical protein